MGWVLGVPVHEGECGDTVLGGGKGRMKNRDSAAGREEDVGVVGEESLEGEREGLGDWGGLANVNVSEEAEAGIGGCDVELMSAILGAKGSVFRSEEWLDWETR